MKQFLFSLLLFCVLSYRVIAGKKIKEKEVQKAGDGHGRDALFSTTSLDAVHSSEISPYFNDKSKVKTQNDTMGWLSKSTRKKARSYATTFKEASLFPHIAINNFMTPAAAEALLAEFPSFESGNYMNEYGVPGKKSIQPNLRTISNTYAKLWKYIGSEEFLSYVSKVTGNSSSRISSSGSSSRISRISSSSSSSSSSSISSGGSSSIINNSNNSGNTNSTNSTNSSSSR